MTRVRSMGDAPAPAERSAVAEVLHDGGDALRAQINLDVQAAVAEPAAPVAEPAPPIVAPAVVGLDDEPAPDDPGRAQFESRRAKIKAETDRLDRLIGNGFAGEIAAAAQTYTGTTADADREAAAAAAEFNYVLGEAALDRVEEAARTFAQALLHSKVPPLGDDRGRAARAAVARRLRDDPDLLRNLVQVPGGGEMLDQLVEGLDGSAGDRQSNAFVIAAMKARYNLESLDGDLSTKALPRLYKVFGMVPASHTAGNPRLKKVARDASWIGAYRDQGLGLYKGDENAIVLHGLVAGRIRGGLQDFVGAHLEMNRLRNVEGERAVNVFDWTTLHEIGHAVDAKEHYMHDHQADAAHGGWTTLDRAEMQRRLADRLKGSWAGYARAFCDRYATVVLAGNNPEADDNLRQLWQQAVPQAASDQVKAQVLAHGDMQEAVTIHDEWQHRTPDNARARIERRRQALDQADSKFAGVAQPARHLGILAYRKIVVDGLAPADAVDQVLLEVVTTETAAQPDWRALKRDPAISWLTKTATLLWKSGGDSGPVTWQEIIYQKTGEDQWTTYTRAAWDARITNYQFRAPGEWFAESYAAYYLGKLRADHPMHDWLQQQEQPG